MSHLCCDTPKSLNTSHNLNKSVCTLLFVYSKGVLARFRRANRKEKSSIDTRGIPSHACLCGSLIFKVSCMFEDNNISLWFTDAECGLCGALVTVPCPADSVISQQGGKIMDVTCRGCSRVQTLPATREQVKEFFLPRTERRLIQEIFPDLSISDRELLISRTCNTCWKNLFGSDDKALENNNSEL